MKICPAGFEVVHADTHPSGQTDRQIDTQTDTQTDRKDEANSRFSQFCERS